MLERCGHIAAVPAQSQQLHQSRSHRPRSPTGPIAIATSGFRAQRKKAHPYFCFSTEAPLLYKNGAGGYAAASVRKGLRTHTG